MKDRSFISCSISADTKPNKDGLVKIYFRIVQNKQKRDLYTGIRWLPECYNKKIQILLPRYADDSDVDPCNLRLNEYKSIAHRLQLNGYLQNKEISLADIVSEFKDVGCLTDFFEFMKASADYLYNKNITVNGTWRRHRSSLNKAKLFSKTEVLPVSKINLDWIQRFDAWARKIHKRKHNTVCGYHKDLKKFLSIAVRKGLILYNPYKDFKFTYVDGNREALTKEDLACIYKNYQDPTTPVNEREISGRFLFSCVTGLRISDTSQIHRKMIIDGVLTLTPHKGRQSGKILKIPLPQNALSLIEGRDEILFHNWSHSYINETLKLVAARAKIAKRLTYHCARDTFGTLFIEMGGDVKSLKDLMGHSSLSTTMIYLKMSDTRKQMLMNNFDTLF